MLLRRASTVAFAASDFRNGLPGKTESSPLFQILPSHIIWLKEVI